LKGSDVSTTKMKPDGPKPPSSASSPMPALEGGGAIMVVGGVLALFGLVVHPEMFRTFLPIGATGCLGGFLLVRWARRAAP